ncbi:putative neuraminidase [Paenibacillus sp. V4I3]|uniref:sialidase family protein n=1 Tax=unclassified Paenibacillus TaxID=185978 RepID=UPI0027818678|nr:MULTISPECIES: sialidase family protein [unclassified Paenibacillus]MDQ0875258.1 putative neuraminidase [Paenibacillus sp. V4I3]MDQ0889010.1 putative neuraminidase [Paenibacillus sp. V4I9]
MKYVNTVKEFIFEDDRPFLSCHASTLELLPGGDVIAAWFGGTREKAGDVAIWVSHRGDGGWTPPVKVADQEDVPHWNPVLFRNNEGVLFLYYKVGTSIAEWETMVIRSTDNGYMWSPPIPLVEGDKGGRGPVKNKPIVLHDGTIAAPASLEPAWDVFVDLSADGGETWNRSETVPLDRSRMIGSGIIQPTLWESSPGYVHMFTRSIEGAIYRSDSVDGGRTWCPAYPTELPNNNSGIDLVKLDNGTIALIYNPTRPETGKKKGPRTPLVIRLSQDNGLTWENEFLLDEGEKQYSYPAIVASGLNLYVTYTWKRERIAFWKITLADLA